MDGHPRLDALVASTEGVWVRLHLVDLTGDLNTAVLLSQILYWHPRLTIEREGARWLAKAHDDWWDEVRLTADQARRAISRLKDLGFIEVNRWKFNGTPTTHLRLVPDALEDALTRTGPEPTSTWVDPPPHLGQDPDPPGPEASSFPSPETTPETTPEDGPDGADDEVTIPVDVEGHHPEADRLCDLLADLVEANGSRRPTVTKRWRTAARLLIEKDGWTPDQVEKIIRWSQSDEFWRANVLAMPKLRERFDTLRLQRNRTLTSRRPGQPGSGADALREYASGVGVLPPAEAAS